MNCTIQIFLDGVWRDAATFTARDADRSEGAAAPGRFAYDDRFALDHIGHARAQCSVHPDYAVGLDTLRTDCWPPFLVDLLPGPAGRREIVRRLGLDSASQSADWDVLMHGAANPPGRLRIREAAERMAPWNGHEGFERRDIVERGEGFKEYARARGAPVSGTSDAQGNAPKFLLTVDAGGRWHADGVLPDEHAARHYLVKFPGANDSATQRRILRNEAAYYRVAAGLPAITTGDALEHESDTLFIPRFDRVPRGDGTVTRFGLESLCSAAGVAEFGRGIAMKALCAVIGQASDDPQADITEFVLRDALNLAMGNPDNHARNTALRKDDAGGVRIAPLFDFAPMTIDESVISRTCRWHGADGNPDAGRPDWDHVCTTLAAYVDETALRAAIGDFSVHVSELPERMHAAGVDYALIERQRPYAEGVARALEAAAAPRPADPPRP